VAIPGDLSLPRLGLDDASYKTLLEEVDSIFHCATSMNHLETYTMAKRANVDSAKDVLDIATQKKPKLINYISTLSVFGGTEAGKTRVVTEQSLIDYERHSSSQGYVASKWVGEKIFLKASDRGIPCNIFRLGLVWADTQKGRYDELQREYRILKSCLLSGYGIKDYRYDLPATPVDYVARAVVFLANQHSLGRGVFHISSSAQNSGGIFERCNEVMGTSLELKSWFEWLSKIKQLHCEGSSLPVVPLVETAFSMDEESFYEYQCRMGSGGTYHDCSRTCRELERAGIVAPALDDDLLKRCLESMFVRDIQVREWLTHGAPYYQRASGARSISSAHHLLRENRLGKGRV
jgi:thioester reductase-like protein